MVKYEEAKKRLEEKFGGQVLSYTRHRKNVMTRKALAFMMREMKLMKWKDITKAMQLPDHSGLVNNNRHFKRELKYDFDSRNNIILTATDMLEKDIISDQEFKRVKSAVLKLRDQ